MAFLMLLLPSFGWSQMTEYTSPDQPDFRSYERTSQYVTLSDFTRIAVDVYMPAKGPERNSFPVIFKMTPYGRAYIAPDVNLIFRTIGWIGGLGWNTLLDQERYSKSISELLKHGYVVVAADMRGTGASFGQQMPLDPQHGPDGKEHIEWVADQSFCNGNVGMLGESYMGWVQYATAAQQPKALKCISPEVIFTESFTASYKPGGIIANRWMNTFSERLQDITLNYSDLSSFQFPSAPVVDEDGDGKIHDEWPMIDSTIFEADAKPRYKDHNNRTKHLYWKATRQHLGNIQVTDLMGDKFGFFDSKTSHPDYEGFTFRDVAPGYYLQSVQESGIPVFHIGRWFDGFSRSTTQLFASSQHLNNHRMLITPGFHMSGMSNKQRKFTGFDEKLNEIIAQQHLMFFDRYLKEIENGWDQLDPVELYIVNNGWRTEVQWPPEEVMNTAFYLQNGNLIRTPTTSGMDVIPVDTLHSSSYGKKGYNRWTMASGTPKDPMERTQIDAHATIYDSEVLEQDTDVIGHPIVELYITSNRPDADLSVYLEEVTADGRAYYVSEGQLRASWNEECDMAEQLGVDYELKPELPWHGYIAKYHRERPFADGDPVKMRFDLMPVGWKFRAGSRIRISVAGLDKGNFEVNPAYFDDSGRLSDSVEIYLHQSAKYPSKVTLPFVGGKTEVVSDEIGDLNYE